MLLLMCSGYAFSQIIAPRFERFGIREGLPHLAVKTIIQDQYGHLWIGTWDGLCRYDGYQFQCYHADLFDEQSLVNSNIKDLFESKEGSLWISTESGVNRYNRLQDNFIRYKSNCKPGQICGGRHKFVKGVPDDQVWLYSSLRGRVFQSYIESEDRFHRIQLNDSLGLEKIHPNFWKIGSGACMLTQPRDSMLGRPFWKNTTGLHIREILISKKNRLFLGTQEGLFYLEEKVFHPVKAFADIPVLCLFEDSRGGLWVGTEAGLYYQPDPKSEWVILRNEPQRANSLSDNTINCLFEDKKGNLWIGTEDGGLNRISLYQPSFFRRFDKSAFGIESNSLVVFSLQKSKDGKLLWAGSNEGLFCFDYETGNKLWHTREELLTPGVLAILEKDNGDILIGHSGKTKGFSCVDGRTGKPQSSLLFEEKETGAVRSFVKNESSYFAIAGIGLHHFFSEKTKQHLDQRYAYNLKRNALNKKDFKYLWAAQAQDSCKLWLASNGGLTLYNWCTDSLLVTQVLDSNSRSGINAILSILAQNDSTIWMGSWGGGLLKWNPKTNKRRHFGRLEGLLSTTVYGIIEDQGGDLWLSTNQGIFRFDPREERFTHFGDEDGLVSAEFASGAHHKAMDGELFFGGRDGFVSFYPEKVHKQVGKAASLPIITGIQISGIEYTGSANTEVLKGLSFLYRPQQSLKISFSDFDFRAGDPPLFRHRLRGYEKRWNKPSSNPSIRYTNLPPGEYTFELERAELSSTTAVRRLKVRIRPQLHQRLWFRILTGLILLFGIGGAIYSRMKASSRKSRMALQRRLAEVKQEALAAQFDQHFTFNSLNSIQRFITENKQDEAVRYIGMFGKLIRRVMLQARENTIPLQEEIQSLELYLSLEKLRTKGQFDFHIHIAQPLDPFLTEVPPMLLQPFVENAIWHGLMPKGEKGTLRLFFFKKEELLVCIVEDDGIGRQQAAELQKDSLLKHQSRGLIMSKERIETTAALIGKEIRMDIIDLLDAEGKAAGTRIELEIPILS